MPRPPHLLEVAVGLLLPASRRDDVLGDLHERYVSVFYYLLDASQVVPIVAISDALRRHPIASAEGTSLSGPGRSDSTTFDGTVAFASGVALAGVGCYAFILLLLSYAKEQLP